MYENDNTKSEASGIAGNLGQSTKADNTTQPVIDNRPIAQYQKELQEIANAHVKKNPPPQPPPPNPSNNNVIQGVFLLGNQTFNTLNAIRDHLQANQALIANQPPGMLGPELIAKIEDRNIRYDLNIAGFPVIQPGQQASQPTPRPVSTGPNTSWATVSSFQQNLGTSANAPAALAIPSASPGNQLTAPTNLVPTAPLPANSPWAKRPPNLSSAPGTNTAAAVTVPNSFNTEPPPTVTAAFDRTSLPDPSGAQSGPQAPPSKVAVFFTQSVTRHLDELKRGIVTPSNLIPIVRQLNSDQAFLTFLARQILNDDEYQNPSNINRSPLQIDLAIVEENNQRKNFYIKYAVESWSNGYCFIRCWHMGPGDGPAQPARTGPQHQPTLDGRIIFP